MRLHNLELRASNIGSTLEIVKWEPNPYFENQAGLRKDGEYWVDDKRRLNIHESCFVNQETCYVIAFIENEAVRFIDNRAVDLASAQEMRDLLTLLKEGTKKPSDPVRTVMKLTNEQMTFLEDNSTHVYDGEDAWYHIPFWFKRLNYNTIEPFTHEHLPGSIIETIKGSREP
jgi:hypothetical protein